MPYIDLARRTLALESEGDGATSFRVAPALRQGPYRMGQVLGRGGMAVVHAARRVGARDTGERFAVKRILPEFSQSAAFVRRFYREAALGIELNHSKIVRVLDFGEQDGEHLLVTELVDGTSCGRMLRMAARREEPFPTPVALQIACEVLEALAYTHGLPRADGTNSGIVHREVSPGNILIGAMGEVKLADFGVAQSADRAQDISPGTLKGKIGYMSPEQIGHLELDARSDLFSLGVVIFEMLTGTRFFAGRDDFEVLARMQAGTLAPLVDTSASVLPLELRLILATALAEPRLDRFWDAREFSNALRAFARHAGFVLERRTVVQWLRGFDIWPLRSGTYPAFPATTVPDFDLAPGESNGGDGSRRS